MKRILTLLLIVFYFNLISLAQVKPSLVIDHIAISVTNLEISTAFYKDILGLSEITNRTENPGIKWFSIGDGKELHMISVVKEPVRINKAVHMAFKTAAFDEFVAKLEKNKIPYSDWPGNPQTIMVRPDSIRQVFFQDPDGYWVEVNSVATEE